MRKLQVLAILPFLIGAMLLPSTARSQSAGPFQPLFVGDKLCADTASACTFQFVVPAHRYLHIVVHDLAGNAEWHVQAASTCTAATTIAGGVPVADGGYLETVVVLSSLVPQSSGDSVCLIFRGRNGWGAKYYAAYFDDRPAPDADLIYPGYQSANGRPDLPDLDVTYIHRSPSYAYDAAHNAPSAGEHVTFAAHVMNAGPMPAPAFAYSWILDGRQLAASTHDAIAPGAEIEIDLPWIWETGPHTLEIRLLAPYDEIAKSNNDLSIRTNALTVGFWIEQSAWQYFQDHQWRYCSVLSCSGSNSFADWLERNIQEWNQLFSQARYPALAPSGIIDRVRVDEITIVPDGALPLHGNLATNDPDVSDHSVDLEWGLPASGIEKAYPSQWNGPFNIDWATMHELGHARSLVDLYRFDIGTAQQNPIEVHSLTGNPIYDPSKPFDPASSLHAFFSDLGQTFIYQNEERDLMSCVCTPSYSAYTAMALNRIQGRRARCGNTNPPCNLGDWMGERPPVNLIKFLDSSGRLLPNNTVVRAYLDTGTAYTGHHFDDSHFDSYRTRNGQIRLSADPFHASNDHWLLGHNLLLLDIRAAQRETFCFIEPTTFTEAYWLGYRNRPATYTLRLGDIRENDCGLRVPPTLVNEPFSTSPQRSILTRSNLAKGRSRLTVQLRDDAIPANPMRRRQLEVLNAGGQVVARCRTSATGACRANIPASLSDPKVLDLTDNSLVIGWAAAMHRLPAARRR
ncbi:MAG: CARDB domain-containing protein [Chloroflexota bacterium]